MSWGVSSFRRSAVCLPEMKFLFLQTGRFTERWALDGNFNLAKAVKLHTIRLKFRKVAYVLTKYILEMNAHLSCHQRNPCCHPTNQWAVENFSLRSSFFYKHKLFTFICVVLTPCGFYFRCQDSMYVVRSRLNRRRYWLLKTTDNSKSVATKTMKRGFKTCAE